MGAMDTISTTPVVSSRARAAATWVALVLLLLLVVVMSVNQSRNAVARRIHAGDFRANIWQPDRDVLHGKNPYPSPDSPAVQGGVPGYPPVSFLVFMPIAALPFVPAAYVWGALMIALSLGALVAVRVRDPMCYVLVLFSMPVVGAAWWGNPTPLIVFTAALAWRWRDLPWLGPLAVAAGFAIKFVTWPLLVWLVLTGRVRSAYRSAVLAVLLIVVPWALIDFRGARTYPALLRAISRVGAPKGSFVQAVALRAGLSDAAALAVGMTVAAILLAIAVVLRGDHRVYSLAILAGFASSPIVWIIYFGVVSVIVGIRDSRLSAAWLLVPALWVGHWMYFPPSPAMLGATLCVIGVLLVWILRRPHDVLASSSSA
jgi:hypothetical protein